jgi:hypothetical protein
VLQDDDGGLVCVSLAEGASRQWLLARRRVAGNVVDVAQSGSDPEMEVAHLLRGVFPLAQKEAVDRYLKGLSALRKAALLKSVQERILHGDDITEELQPCDPGNRADVGCDSVTLSGSQCRMSFL